MANPSENIHVQMIQSVEQWSEMFSGQSKHYFLIPPFGSNTKACADIFISGKLSS